jgi:hypothetical protein
MKALLIVTVVAFGFASARHAEANPGAKKCKAGYEWNFGLQFCTQKK